MYKSRPKSSYQSHFEKKSIKGDYYKIFTEHIDEKNLVIY